MEHSRPEERAIDRRILKARQGYFLRTAVRSLAELPRDLALRSALVGRGLGPLPPPHLRHRVIGDHRADRFHEAGLLALRDLERALAIEGTALESVTDLLDFGVGCGKLLRWLGNRAPRIRISGSDIDGWAVSWLRRAYPGLDLYRNDEWPPLRFADGSFDLVVAISVFTHLDEAHQDAWLRELHRVLRPGGLLLATFEGPTKWRAFYATAPDHPGMQGYRREYEEKGLLFVTNDGWTGIFPDFYHSAFHAPEYVRKRWGEVFEVRNVIPDGLRGNWGTQDLAVLRKGGAKAPGATA